MTPTPGPRTEAGKRIMAGWDEDTAGESHAVTRGFVEEVILSVEAEARADVPISVPVVWNFALPAEGTQPRADVDGPTGGHTWAEHIDCDVATCTVAHLARREARADVDGLVALQEVSDMADATHLSNELHLASMTVIEAARAFRDADGSKPRAIQAAQFDLLNAITDYDNRVALLIAGDKAEAPNFPVLDYPENGAVMDKAEAPLLTIGVDDTLLVKLSEDDIMYDHPVSSMQEPADPVLFVRWDAILALLHPSAGDKAEAPE